MIDGPSPLVTRQRLTMGVSLLLAIGIPAILLMPHDIALGDPRSVITPTSLVIANMEPATEAVAIPMFNAERRSPVFVANGGGAPEGGSTTAEAGPPTPVGLITGRKIQGLALVRSANGQTAVARVADIIDGWKVTAVSTAGVTFQKGSEEKQVGLEYGNRSQSGGEPPSLNPTLPSFSQPGK